MYSVALQMSKAFAAYTLDIKLYIEEAHFAKQPGACQFHLSALNLTVLVVTNKANPAP
jgi:hypothetical protein